MENDKRLSSRKSIVLCVLVLTACMVAPLITGCGGDEKGPTIGVTFLVGGSGTNVNIVYIDAEGVTQNVTGYDLSANSGRWDYAYLVDPGANLYLSATDVSGSDMYLDVSVIGQQVLSVLSCTTAWVSYAVPSDEGTQSVSVDYRVLGSGTSVIIDYIDSEGNAKSVSDYNLNANSNRWDFSFDADSGAPLDLTAYSDVDDTIIQIFIDNQQVLHGEVGDAGWSSYVVP